MACPSHFRSVEKAPTVQHLLTPRQHRYLRHRDSTAKARSYLEIIPFVTKSSHYQSRSQCPLCTLPRAPPWCKGAHQHQHKCYVPHDKTCSPGISRQFRTWSRCHISCSWSNLGDSCQNSSAPHGGRHWGLGTHTLPCNDCCPCRTQRNVHLSCEWGAPWVPMARMKENCLGC